MDAKLASKRPFGNTIARRFKDTQDAEVAKLRVVYARLGKARSMNGVITRARQVTKFVDSTLDHWRKFLGGGDSGFSAFRGTLLEEITLRLAEEAIREAGMDGELEAVKLATGQGVVTGISLAFRTGNLPDPVPMRLSRNREDVIVGYRRTLRIESPDATEHTRADFPDELVPIIVIACKMYIDATRLENVLAKASSFYEQYAKCQLLVVAEIDALKADDHDSNRQILDSLTAPISDLFFLRGKRASRQKGLQRAAVENPYDASEMRRLAETIRSAIRAWKKS
jgi:hypothetical protein